jgi:hypothetical protein
MNGDSGGQWAKKVWLQYGLLALALWTGMSVFLIFDLAGAISVYLKFTAVYAAFWVLVGSLLLHGRPWREKLLILGLSWLYSSPSVSSTGTAASRFSGISIPLKRE